VTAHAFSLLLIAAVSLAGPARGRFLVIQIHRQLQRYLSQPDEC